MFIKRIHLFGLLFLCFLFGAVSVTVYDVMATKETKKTRRARTSDVIKQIDMTEAQRAQLNAILEEGRKRIIELNRSMRPELSKIRKECRSQMRDILTGEQQLKFDQLLAEQDRSRHSKKEKKESKPER